MDLRVVAVALLATGCGRTGFERSDTSGVAEVPEVPRACEPNADGLCTGTPVAIITIAAAGPDGRIGMDVAADGNRALVGAPGAGASGRAYVLERPAPGSPYQAVAELSASDGVAGASYGVAVDLEGDRAVVGADNADGVGAVYVLERQAGGTWAERARLGAVDTGQFGAAVDLQGDRIIVGAPSDGGGLAWGAAYIFERQAGGDWSQVARLDGEGGSNLGCAVAIDGLRAVVGSLWDSNPDEIESGAGRVYERQPDGSWPLVATLFPSTALATDAAGAQVAVQGDRVVLGAPWAYPDGVRNTGLLLVYERQPDATWKESAVLQLSVVNRDATLGRGVALRGDRIFATAVDYDADRIVVGVFRREAGASWRQVALLHEDSAANETGDSLVSGIEGDLQIGVSGDSLLVGCPGRGYSRTTYQAPGAVAVYDVTGM